MRCGVVEVAGLDSADGGTRLLTLRTLDYFLTQPFFFPPRKHWYNETPILGNSSSRRLLSHGLVDWINLTSWVSVTYDRNGQKSKIELGRLSRRLERQSCAQLLVSCEIKLNFQQLRAKCNFLVGFTCSPPDCSFPLAALHLRCLHPCSHLCTPAAIPDPWRITPEPDKQSPSHHGTGHSWDPASAHLGSCRSPLCQHVAGWSLPGRRVERRDKEIMANGS